ncbi:uncharacterized protein VDAG_05930 [Verticillium dahliae VdLs.17]|uniref:PH domain-containing protein n=1 Tax=Verticillium dahliae (strain VdLs.17 / ATCC MYA-4575 / FGSC 10137) TaxID=498257 RepID=G2X6Z8_VERDV|nr:uncharacterized protein VDAG_05930 [Verticillium dahliae VdLs.17]EGY14766.1 hypothetical protein VDAG_05930 [Verticillium dahliae VdLs.17]
MSSRFAAGGEGFWTAASRSISSSSSSTSTPSSTTSTARHDAYGRRLSVEEDLFYQQLMTADPRPPSEPPPPYRPQAPRPASSLFSATDDRRQQPQQRQTHIELPPEYHTDIDLAAVWELKMELEDAVDRADDRTWHTVIVELRGTSLKLYSVKKEWTQWGWGAAREWASSNQSPDNPPWARRATLLRTYHLQHADIGIAADYKKRRNVIRLRLETDQLLLSCLESATFVRWLDAFFAAMAIAAPLDEREYPADQSVPRSQRTRWLQAQRRGLALAPRAYSPSITSSLSLSSHLDMDADPYPSPEMSDGTQGMAGQGLAQGQGSSEGSTPALSRRSTTGSASFRRLVAAAGGGEVDGKWAPPRETWDPPEEE